MRTHVTTCTSAFRTKLASAPAILCTLLLVLSLVGADVRLAAGQGLGADQKRLQNSGVNYFNLKDQALSNCGSTNGGAGGGGTQLTGPIPSVWRDLINSVAAQYPDADPRLVAATLWAENRGWPEYKTSGWGVSGAGAAGPWQFIPSTWASMGTDGDGDGRADRDNPKDAVHAAFKHQLGSAGKPVANTGYSGSSADNDFQTTVFERNGNNLLSFMANYNGRGAPNGVALKDFPRNENSDYVRMGYWLLATNFVRGWHPETGDFVDAATTGAMFGGGGQPGNTIPGSQFCPSGSGVVIDNYSFPVAPQKKSQNGGVNGMSPLPCTNPSGCHHDGSVAFDLSRKPGGDSVTGTPVYAITKGRVRSIRASYQGIAGCQSLQLIGDEDKFWYWYGHIQSVSVNEDQEVAAGQQIAVIGERKCTGNGSDNHLHLDRGCVVDGVPQPGGRTECRDSGLNDIINGLFNKLPE